MASRKYYIQCPYCNKSYERQDMPTHLEKHHLDELPDGFTPLRVTYHIANKKSFSEGRRCRVCGKFTPWDEKKGRYNQLCGDPECKRKQAERMNKNMGDKLRSNSPTKSAEGLEKMLNNRGIAKKYIFQDGTPYTCIGNNEMKFLKFADLVVDINPEDLQSPGPLIYYMYKGEEHLYIPDYYYIPYNLIIEIKDGGDHKNNAEAWKETRERVIAKEKHIIENTDYNYIRLTDNDFSQLLAVFADLKMHLIENDKDRVIHVNESAPMIGQGDIVLVNYKQRSYGFLNRSKIAVSPDINFDSLWGIDDNGKLTKISKKILIDSEYSLYKVGDNALYRFHRFLKEYYHQPATDDMLYEAVFDKKRYSDDQILFEKEAETIWNS